jgi:hypothetical protein
MEKLIKKIKELKSTLQNLKQSAVSFDISPIPEIKPPSISVSRAGSTKIPGINPESKKDPKKVAEQLKSAQLQKLKKPMIKYADNGQWSLED